MGGAAMEIVVQIDADNLNLKISPSTTIRDLKKLIEEEINIVPERQTLYLLGYKISDEELRVENLLMNMGTDKLPPLTLVLPKAGKHQFFSEREVFIITGTRRNFQSKLLKKQTTQKMKLSSPLFSRDESFAIVYPIEGDEPGNKRFHASKYTIRDRNGCIKIRETADAFRVLLVPNVEDTDNDDDAEELVGETKVYNEAENINLGNVLNTVARGAEFVGN